jgi:hypothetical protein
MLAFAFLFLKKCRTELKEIMECFTGILSAAMQEFRFRGGRAAKANVVLSVLLAILFVLLCIHGVLGEVREFLGGEHDQDAVKYLYVLFALLIIFFLTSLCIVSADDRYIKKISGRTASTR